MFTLQQLLTSILVAVLPAANSGGGMPKEVELSVQHETDGRGHRPLPSRQEVRASGLQVQAT